MPPKPKIVKKAKLVSTGTKSTVDASTGTETDATQSTTETLNAKTKEELIEELVKLINDENK